MNLKKDLEIIEKSGLFRKWNKKTSYLVSCFFLDDRWQFDFYSKKTKKISSFALEENNVKIIEENSQVFQKTQKDLEELKLNEVKTKLETALNILNQLKKEKAPLETASKKIIILQKINFPLWNISYITSAFNLLNVKINAVNSKIIEQDFTSIINFKK